MPWLEDGVNCVYMKWEKPVEKFYKSFETYKVLDQWQAYVSTGLHKGIIVSSRLTVVSHAASKAETRAADNK